MTQPRRIALWNTEWASLRSKRGRVIRELIIAEAPDLVCLTEATPDLVPDGGHLLTPGDEPRHRGCRDGEKALLWSQRPWSRTQTTLPGTAGGRFVEGRTGPRGDIRVTGVCIPWHDSRTRYGEVRRKQRLNGALEGRALITAEWEDPAAALIDHVGVLAEVALP